MSNISKRERGSTLIVVLIIITVLAALAAAASELAVANARASMASDVDMRLFYLADSGAQSANARIWASNGTLANTSFEESIDEGTAQVSITAVSTDLYKVVSTGHLSGEQKTVTMHVHVEQETYDIEGAVQMVFDNGVEIEDMSSIPVHLHDSSIVSGMDHATGGSLATDQTAAIRGLAMNEVPGSVDFGVTQDATATLEGSPTATMNTADGQKSVLNALRRYTRRNADVVLGSSAPTLDDAHTGSYGTESDPKLVYVRLDEDDTLTLEGGFSGHGTLFVDIEEAEEVDALRLRDSASWTGPVVLYFFDEAEVEGGSLVSLQNDSRILGGLIYHFSGEEVEIDDDDDDDGGTSSLLEVSGTSSILFSRDLTKTAPGFNNVLERTISVIAYQI